MTENKNSKLIAIAVLIVAIVICGIIFVPKYISGKNNGDNPQAAQAELSATEAPEA
jgi:flagellar basal body-associated protein FliL